MSEMAKGDWWFKFEIPAWRNSPELRLCSLAARGFWMDCIAIMRDTGKATISGTYEDFARSIGCFPNEAEQCINELRRNKTADVTLRNDCVTVKSRKYARELKAKELTRLRVQRHRKNANVTPKKRLSERSNKKEVIQEEKKGETPVAATAAVSDSVERRIWTDGIELLVKNGLKETQSRPLLGRLAKEYGNDRLAEAIAVTQAQNPVDPKGFLIGVLRERSGKNRSQVGRSIPATADDLLESCLTCFDTGEKLITVNGKLTEVPCTECSQMAIAV